MSATLVQAYETARDSLNDGLTIYAACESPARWFFLYGMSVALADGAESEVVPVPGGQSLVAISKASGEVCALDLPAVPSFVTGNPQTPDEAELDQAIEIELPAA